MADPVAIPDDGDLPKDDVDIEMEGTAAAEQVLSGGDESVLPGRTDDMTPRIPFMDYLKAPIVELNVGSGVDRVVLYAHQDLLTKSPFFEQRCAELTAKERTIDLPEEDTNAVGSFLEYLYNNEYFPRRLTSSRDSALETDPSLPEVDEDGSQLLRHARIYTLAEKFQMPSLKSLAHSKVNKTYSTARGEIAYARYVYASTAADDRSIRDPVAQFWAVRSHTLRHEAEEEFRAMCLEFPQFGFDVLTRVLDRREKAAGGAAGASAVGVAVETPQGSTRGKKRQRMGAA